MFLNLFTKIYKEKIKYKYKYVLTAFNEKSLMDESNDVIKKVIINLKGNYYHRNYLEELIQPLVDRIANLNKKIMFLQENPTSGIKI